MKKKLKYARNIHVLFDEKQYEFLKSLDISNGEFLRGLVDEHIQQVAEQKREERRQAAARAQQQERERKEREEAEKLKPPPRGLTDQEMAKVRQLKEAAYRMGLLRPGALDQGRKN